MSQRSMEFRVGVLVLIALALLAAFVLVMTGVSFAPTYMVYVDFDNPGGLKTGAPVRIAGVKVGRVSAMEFHGASLDPRNLQRQPFVRVAAALEDRFASSVFDNSKWFVTTQGILGEFCLGLAPGTPDRPLLKAGAIMRGLSPPRLDLLLSEAYELLNNAYTSVGDNKDEIRETFDDLHRTLKGTGDFFEKDGPKLDRIVDDLESMERDAHDTLLAARTKFVDNPAVDRILHDADATSGSLAADLPPLLADGKKVAAGTTRLLAGLSTADQIERYQSITRDAAMAANDTAALTQQGRKLLSRIKDGKGTVGAFLMDESIYDDVEELVRDLKHNPWKLFWRN